MTDEVSKQQVHELMDALHDYDFKTVREWLELGADVNLPYANDGWTPFLWACSEYESPVFIKMFLKYGGDVNSKTNRGLTGLHIMAQRRNSFDCLKVLLDAEANPDAQSNTGQTPLMMAVRHPYAMMRRNVICNLLLRSDRSIKDNKGRKAYNIARANRAFNDKILLLLLKDVNDVTNTDWDKIICLLARPYDEDEWEYL